jgi:hypothetical protein
MWNNCRKSIDNTCKTGKLGQLGILALSRNYQRGIQNQIDDESQLTK